MRGRRPRSPGAAPAAPHQRQPDVAVLLGPVHLTAPVRPLTRCCSSQGTLEHGSPARSTSTVRAVSTPQPRASGLAASKAAGLMQRMPESGCTHGNR